MLPLVMQVVSLSDGEKARLPHLERRLLAAVGRTEAVDFCEHTCNTSHDSLT